MNAELRHKIWQRDGGICQECKKELFDIIEPYEEAIDGLLNMKDIPILKWSQKCWKCKKETDVVTYDFCVDYDHQIGSIEKLDQILMEKFGFVKKVFSQTMGEEVIANTCTHCGATQGNWCIMEDLIEMKSSNVDMNKLIHTFLPNTLRFEDLHIKKEELEIEEEEIPLLAHVHHIDTNRSNNNPENLILLCKDCHVRIHTDLRKRYSI